VEGQNICNQVIVLNELALFIPHIFGNYVVAAERDPLYELVNPCTSCRAHLPALGGPGCGNGFSAGRTAFRWRAYMAVQKRSDFFEAGNFGIDSLNNLCRVYGFICFALSLS
jgi:hypothetical protein